MLNIDIAILSNRCGCAASRRRKQKLLYAGSGLGLERFVATSNLFVSDEKHRYAIEYHFRVKCTLRRSDLWRNSTASSGGNGPTTTWTELCHLLDQFLCFPMAARPTFNDSATMINQPEHVIVLLLDEDEQAVLLNMLFKMQRTAETMISPEVVCLQKKSTDSKIKASQDDAVDISDDATSAVADDKQKNSLSLFLEPWRSHTAAMNNPPDDGSPLSAISPPQTLTLSPSSPNSPSSPSPLPPPLPPLIEPITVFSHCQQKLVELRQLRESLDV